MATSSKSSKAKNSSISPKHDQENFDPIQNPKVSKGKLEKVDWENAIQISTNEVNFCKMLPGQIMEKEFSVTNPTKASMEMRILVECLTEGFDDLEEYVFTLRSSDSNNYHHRHRTLFVPYSRAYFKVALKVPNVKEQKEIKGKIILQIGNKGEIPSAQLEIPLIVKAELPSLYCPKTLELSPFPCLRLTAKKGRKTEYKIPLRNDSCFDMNFNIEIISKDSDALLFPSGNGGFLASNTSGVILVGVRGAIQTKKLISRKILVLKVKGSSLLISIPIEIELS